MAAIKGITRDKNGAALPCVSVELKNEQFQTVYQAESDEQGQFALTVPDGDYPFLTAVRDYTEKYLEFWAHDISAYGEVSLDITIDTLEIYGINAFEVKGPGKTLSIYFRPMSLEKFLAREQDIAPEFDTDGICVKLNGTPTEVVAVNRVQEYIGEGGFCTGYLIQAALPANGEQWHCVELTLRDRGGSFGSAVLFRKD